MRLAIDCGCDLRNELAYLATKIKYGAEEKTGPWLSLVERRPSEP